MRVVSSETMSHATDSPRIALSRSSAAMDSDGAVAVNAFTAADDVPAGAEAAKLEDAPAKAKESATVHDSRVKVRLMCGEFLLDGEGPVYFMKSSRRLALATDGATVKTVSATAVNEVIIGGQ